MGNVLNLSSQTLSAIEIKILSKGLSFIPKPKKLDIWELFKDTNEFIRKVRTRYRMGETNRRIRRHPFYIRNKKFKPRPVEDQCLENCLESIKVELMQMNYTQNTSDNLSREERMALKSLRERDLIINEADKGSTVVVQDRSDYVHNAMTRHLNDTSVYEPLSENPTETLKGGIEKKLDALYKHKVIDKATHEFTKPPKEHRTSALYFLKKIHKNPMKERPIVSSCSSITENLSAYVDHWLQPRMKELPSYIQDSTEFINILEETPIPENAILASIDVSSLYTNIPHSEGTAAAVKAIRESPSLDPFEPPAEVIGELIDIVLKNNAFEFDERYYLQKQGTAMGTKMAPAYANLFMGEIEERLQSDLPGTILWKRYIDDIFVVATCTIEEFQAFMERANTIHETIKFTHEVSETETTFLDVTVYKGTRFRESNILDIKTHIKDTNKQLYVQATSYHPPSTRKGIAKGEAKRYLRTNSNKDNFEEMKHKLRKKLRERGYKDKTILKQLREIKFSDRHQALRRSARRNERPLTFVTRYTDKSREIRDIIMKHWKVMQQQPRLRTIFSEEPIVAFRKNQSLRNKLVSARLKPSTEDTGEDPSDNTGTEPQQSSISESTRHLTRMPRNYPWNLFNHKQRVKKCGQRNCRTCKALRPKNWVQAKDTKQRHPISNTDELITCQSERLVYLIECKQCKLQYVGQTMGSMNNRLLRHLHRSQQSYVHRHFDQPGHARTDMCITPLHKVPNELPATEARRTLIDLETHWIKRLNTEVPKGLNALVQDTHTRYRDT